MRITTEVENEKRGRESVEPCGWTLSMRLGLAIVLHRNINGEVNVRAAGGSRTVAKLRLKVLPNQGRVRRWSRFVLLQLRGLASVRANAHESILLCLRVL